MINKKKDEYFQPSNSFPSTQILKINITNNIQDNMETQPLNIIKKVERMFK